MATFEELKLRLDALAEEIKPPLLRAKAIKKEMKKLSSSIQQQYFAELEKEGFGKVINKMFIPKDLVDEDLFLDEDKFKKFIDNSPASKKLDSLKEEGLKLAKETNPKITEYRDLEKQIELMIEQNRDLQGNVVLDNIIQLQALSPEDRKKALEVMARELKI